MEERQAGGLPIPRRHRDILAGPVPPLCVDRAEETRSRRHGQLGEDHRLDLGAVLRVHEEHCPVVGVDPLRLAPRIKVKPDRAQRSGCLGRAVEADGKERVVLAVRALRGDSCRVSATGKRDGSRIEKASQPHHSEECRVDRADVRAEGRRDLVRRRDLQRVVVGPEERVYVARVPCVESDGDLVRGVAGD